MGLLPGHLHILAIEQGKRPCIDGDVLTLGEQAVYATLKEVHEIYRRHDLALNELPDDFDTANKIPAWKQTVYEKNTNAHAALTLLGARRVYSVDVNDYENPDFIFDLNDKVDNAFHERFDVVFDCGTLEHVFNVPEALKNICRMLKPGGMVVLMNPASNAVDHGFYSFSPTLFYDFFQSNGFQEFSCYLMEVNNYNYLKKGRVFRYKQVGREYPLNLAQGMDVCFFAKKRKSLTEVEYNPPAQSVYPAYFWNKEKYREGLFKTTKMKELLKKIELTTSSFRPVWIDRLVKDRKRRAGLEYLGRF
ncbi:MAG: methyltransferase [Candidatus Omnitrophota bacterium]